MNVNFGKKYFWEGGRGRTRGVSKLSLSKFQCKVQGIDNHLQTRRPVDAFMKTLVTKIIDRQQSDKFRFAVLPQWKSSQTKTSKGSLILTEDDTEVY